MKKIYRRIPSHRCKGARLYFMVRSDYSREAALDYRSLRKLGISPIAAREQVLLRALWYQHGDSD